MSRPTIAIGLPVHERDAVLEHLAAADFGTLNLQSTVEVEEALRAETSVGLAILDATGDLAALKAILSELRADGAAIPTLMVADGDLLEILDLAGAFTGADEVALRPVDPETLRWRAEAMLIRAEIGTEESSEEGNARVVTKGRVEAAWASRTPIIAVFNPKGGVGKTTIATNLASALQNRRDRKVLLLDADTVTGHVTMSLGMDTTRTMADAWRDEDEGAEPEGLLDVATLHESGIRVAALVSSPLAMPHLDPERVADALMAARWGVDAIVVDLHPSYSEVNLAIFGVADRIIVPVTPDLPAIRAAVQLCDVAAELGLRDRLSLVVNRAESGVSVTQIEQTVGLTCIAPIRSGGMLFVRAANEGRTVTDLFPKEKVSHDFEKLADRLLALYRGEVVEAATEPTRSLLGSLFGRKEPARV